MSSNPTATPTSGGTRANTSTNMTAFTSDISPKTQLPSHPAPDSPQIPLPKSSSHPDPLSSSTASRPSLPQRSASTLTGAPPADAIKADSEAVSDVYKEVGETGSLELAARKLQVYARAWEDDPEEREYLESRASHQSQGGKQDGSTKMNGVEASAGMGTGTGVEKPKMSLAQQRMMQAFADEQEGDEMDQDQAGGAEEDYGVFEDDDEEEDEQEEREVVHLQQVEEGLWIGDLVAAMDTPGLEQRGITNIVSLLRPRLTFPSHLALYPLEIDDSPDTDILTHLPGAVQWIQAALDRRDAALAGRPIDEENGKKPGGVLIHCQAGVSRSATVTAAYLMRSRDLDPSEAIEMIQQHRSHVDPSATFRYQLELFHEAGGRVSLKDKPTRRFYMERTTSSFMNGDGSAPPMDKMAKYPATPTPSNPPTPMGGHGRRKIRCKMCRRQLAVREHMMDHILDQSPISRPRTPSNFALPSPRQSFSSGPNHITAFPERRKSIVSDVINPLTGLPGAVRSRQSSMSMGIGPLSALCPISPTDSETKQLQSRAGDHDEPMISPKVPMPMPKSFPPTSSHPQPTLTMTAASPEAHTGVLKPSDFPPNPHASLNTFVSSPLSTHSRSLSADPPKPLIGSESHSRDSSPISSNRREYQSADQLASRLPPHLLALRQAGGGGGSASLASPTASSPASSPEKDVGPSAANSFPSMSGSTTNSNGNSLGATGINRRRSLLTMTSSMDFGQRSTSPRDRERTSSGSSEIGFGGSIPNAGPPILANPKCSGYFVEPLTWMEPVLKNGDISGKLMCPNEKCGVKIGNFDWAGVQCGCREWVTPGFCIHRSKVDEVW